MSARFDKERRLQEAAEVVQQATWIEAAKATLKLRESFFIEQLRGDDPASFDISNARKHINAIRRISQLLEGFPGLPTDEMPLRGSDDARVRRIRRQERLCPQGWRETIREPLMAAAYASEEKFISEGSGDESNIYDAIEMRSFVASLDIAWARGEEARAAFRRDNMRGVA